MIGRPLTILILLAAPLPIGAEAPVRIILRAEAETTGDFVRLAEIGEVAGLPEVELAACAGIFLGPSPAEGGVRTIEADEIRARLFRWGFEPDIAGAAAVEVRRVPAPVAGWADRIRSALREAIRASLGEEADVTMEVSSLRTTDLPIIGEEAEVGGVPEDGWTWGLRTVDLRLVSEGTAVELPVEVLVRNRRFRWIAVDPLPQGRIVRAGDLRREPVPDGEAVGFEGDPVGMETDVSLRRGEVLPADGLLPPTVVRRGDLLSAEREGAGTRVLLQARAIESGRPGERIRVRIERSGWIGRAVVTGPGRVRIGSEGGE